MYDSENLALHATIYTWAAEQISPGWVLDLGCEYGFGSLLIAATNPKLKVVAIDFDLPMLLYAQNKPLQKKIQMINANAFKLPTASQIFSGIFLINLLHLVEEPEKVLLEVKRALKPGGIALISIPQEASREKLQGGSNSIWQLELEINAQFSDVTFPKEIRGRIPAFPSRYFCVNSQDSNWMVLCRNR